MSSPAAREFDRVDDAAIFIEDTFDESTARSIAGTSATAMVMLSPQRLPDEGEESPHAHRWSGETDNDIRGSSRSSQSVRLPLRKSLSSSRPLADLSNHPNGSPLEKEGHRLSYSSVDHGRLSAHVPLPRVSVRKETQDRAISPYMDSDEFNELFVHRSELDKMERDRSRYREMHRYQAQMCDEYYRREQEAQAQLQEKIVQIVALSSRNEESKRFIRQMKKEMLQCRERALPFINRKLEDTRAEQEVRERYEQLLTAQQEQFEKVEKDRKEEIAALRALLDDVKCLESMGKRTDSLLRASYHKNTHLYGELCTARREWQAEVDHRLELERTLEVVRREKREAETCMARERRRQFAREDELTRENQVLQERIMQLTTELLCMQSEAAEESETRVNEEEHRNSDETIGGSSSSSSTRPSSTRASSNDRALR